MNQQPAQPFSVQSGFNSDVEDDPSGGGSPLLGTRPFRLGWKSGENTSNIVLLDDHPQIVRRHRISRQNLGKFRDARITCASPTSRDPAPRVCLVCEAALRNDEFIKRRFGAYLTVIDESSFVSKTTGKSYKDMKYILELDFGMFQTLQKVHAAMGGLVGMRFMVVRDTVKTSKVIGSSWTPLGPVNPSQHFSQSPAIPALMQAAQRLGNQINAQQALQQMVSHIDYAKELNNYTVANAEQFIAIAVAKDHAQSYGNAPSQGYGPSNQTAGFPSGGYQPPQAMPVAQVPDFSVPTSPQQSTPALTPVMPDPHGAVQPQQQQQQQTPPWDVQQPPAPAPAPAPVGGNYNFGQPQQGWQPGFPQPQQPAQPAQPAQQQPQPQPQQPAQQWQAPQVPNIQLPF